MRAPVTELLERLDLGEALQGLLEALLHAQLEGRGGLRENGGGEGLELCMEEGFEEALKRFPKVKALE
jgi:hypothetical protein